MPRFYQNIQGCFDFDDVYDLVLRRCGSRPAHLLEIGCERGRSTCYLAERIRETGLDVRLDVVDTLQLGDDDLWPQLATHLERARVLSRVHVHRCASSVVAEAFGPGRLDFVFINTEEVTRELALWWPKVRPGGLIAGHGYSRSSGAVDQFVARNGLGPAFRTSRDSWMIHKSVCVDAFYCINLASRPDRRERVTRSLQQAGILPSVEFFNATDGTTLSHPRVISDGQAGCCASHLQVMTRAAIRGHGHVLIFEDDADLVPDFSDRFAATLARCPASYDLCYFGALCHRDWGNYLYPFDDLLSRAGHVFGTHAYLVNLERLTSIYNALRDYRQVIDQWYARELQPHSNCYVSTPYLVYQEPGHSDVSGIHNPHMRLYSGYVWR